MKTLLTIIAWLIMTDLCQAEWVLGIQDMRTNKMRYKALDQGQEKIVLEGRMCLIGGDDGTSRGIICVVGKCSNAEMAGTEATRSKEGRLHIYDRNSTWIWTLTVGWR